MSTNPEYKSWPQFVTAYAALAAVFCSGIHLAWPSPSLPRIFSKEYPINVSSAEGSYIVIIGPVGDIIGNMAFSFSMDLLGRKTTILLIGVPQLISMVMIYFSAYSVGLLYAARVCGGVSEGGCFTVLPLYVCEIAEPRVRGKLGSSFTLFFISGMVFSNVIGSCTSIYNAALVYIACTLIFMLVFNFVPKSPYFLIMKDQIEDARSNLRKLRGCQDVEDELSSLVAAIRRQMSEKGRFKDLVLIESNRKASMVMIVLRVLQQASGVTSFTLYAQLLFRNVTGAIPEHWGAIIMMVIQAFASLVAILVLDHIGRKPIILLSVAGCFFTLTFNALFFTLRDFTTVDVSSLGVLPLVGLFLFMISFSMGLGSAVNVLLGELFPASVKAKAAAVMNMIFAVGMMTTTKFYQKMVDHHSIVIPFAVFALTQFVGFWFCLRLVPETRCKTLEQIQLELKGEINF